VDHAPNSVIDKNVHLLQTRIKPKYNIMYAIKYNSTVTLRVGYLHVIIGAGTYQHILVGVCVVFFTKIKYNISGKT